MDRFVYKNLMGTINQKSTIQTQKRKSNPNNTIDSHHITRKMNKNGRKEKGPARTSPNN